jgi:5'-methylthioadenosine phosphorylase
MSSAKVGIIGGSGFYEMEGLKHEEDLHINTPFGDPSGAIQIGSIDNIKVAFLPRHGKGHIYGPGEIPVKANIYALKSLGVEFIFSVCAVGSLKEKIKPLDMVVPDQIIDRTKSRPSSFFGNGIVAHIPFADPFCPVLGDILYNSAYKQTSRVHDGGICIVMEGPQFSTRAESELYRRSWGADVIVMTLLPEAKLAREAEICYANISIVTDYDCWNEASASVSVEMVLDNQRRMVNDCKEIIKKSIKQLPKHRDCICTNALQNAIATTPELIPQKVKDDLSIIIGKYIK